MQRLAGFLRGVVFFGCVDLRYSRTLEEMLRKTPEGHVQNQMVTTAKYLPKTLLEAILFTIILLTVWPLQDLFDRIRGR